MTSLALGIDEPTVIFDGQCALCLRFVGWARARMGEQVSFVPALSIDAEAIGLSQTDLKSSVWIVEPGGRKATGADAVVRVLGFIGGPWRTVAAIARVPPFSAVCRIGYRVVALNRHRLSSCCDDSCDRLREDGAR